MPFDISALLYELVKKIVFDAISKRVNLSGESFLTRRKIENRIENSLAHVVEQLLPFFQAEHVSETKQELLISTCELELRAIISDPKELFAASLDGQKVFDRRYPTGQLPQSIREEGLDDLYALIFPQVANLVCAFPPAIEQWKIEGYRDTFRRLDDIAATLGNVANKLDAITLKDSKNADTLLLRVRQSLAQIVEFQLDLTGLRGDRPDAVPLEKCFVVPEFAWTVEDLKTHLKHEKRVGTEAEIRDTFAAMGARRLIIGAPGSGKSTWCRWLQRSQLTCEEPRLAVLVRLRDLIKGEGLPSFQEMVRDAAGIHLKEEVTSAVVRGWCKQGLITFIVDGFDEIPPSSRDKVLAWMKGLDEAIERAGLILTTRPLTTDHLNSLSENWNSWELLAFDEPRVNDYISKWYANAPLLTDKDRNVNTLELARRWVNDPALTPLIGTPLMLATILMVHHIDGELPGGRAKLYKRYIDGMMGLWDSRWGVPASIDLRPDLKRKIMTRLALHLHMTEIEQLSDGDIEQLIAKILPDISVCHDASDVLDHLRERTGLLIGPGTWSFVHKNVGEFLVAEAVRDGDQVDNSGQRIDRLRLFKERSNDRWYSVLFFWAGLTAPGDLQSFIEQVSAENTNEDFLLALGLMYDQLQPDRISEPWKSDQLLRMLSHGYSAKETTHFISLSTPKEIRAEVEVPFIHNRTKTAQEPLHRLVWECLRKSNLTCDNALTDTHSSLRFIVWLYYAGCPETTDELRKALSNNCLTARTLSSWTLLSLQWATINSVERQTSVPLQDIIDAYVECNPELTGIVIFTLLHQFMYAVNKSIGGRKDNPFLLPLLRTIIANQKLVANVGWLAQSKYFNSATPFGDSTVDLLEEFPKCLNSCVSGALIADESIASQAIEVVAKLKLQREAIST